MARSSGTPGSRWRAGRERPRSGSRYGRTAWGVGYGTETVRALLGLGFEELGLHRVWAARSPLNTVSKSVLDRAGMTEEGRIRHHVHVRGAWRDSLVHSIIEDEWTAQGSRPQ